MRNKKRKIFFLSVLVFIGLFGWAGSSFAASWYVRPNGGFYGNEDGTDWANAFDGFRDIIWASVNPGDTIFLAGGTYTQGMDIRAAGTSGNRIYIKRATGLAHGSETGWSAGFDSQVLMINGANIQFSEPNIADFVTIDGVVEDGIRINHPDSVPGIVFWRGSNYVTLQYIKVVGPGKNHTYAGGTTGIDITPWNGNNYDDTSHLTISHADISETETLMQVLGASYLTVEYTKFHDNGAANSAVWHPNILYVGHSSNYGTIRYNNFYNINGEGLFFTDGGQTGWKIYGNVFNDCSSSGRAIEWHQDGTYGVFDVFNNTFINFVCGYGFAPRGVVSGNVQNNIFYNSGYMFSNMSHNYNAASNIISETNGVSNLSSNSFSNYSGKDFHIVSDVAPTYPRNKGTPKTVEYSTDMDGVIRGTDGVWDIGAYEYSSGGSPDTTPPAAPSGLAVN